MEQVRGEGTKCSICGFRPVERVFSKKQQKFYYRKVCGMCRRPHTVAFLKRTDTKERPHRYIIPEEEVMQGCSMCGFIPKHICQMDIDHIDRNRHNNDRANLQVLCSNCHRLKTQEENCNRATMRGSRRKPKR